MAAFRLPQHLNIATVNGRTYHADGRGMFVVTDAADIDEFAKRGAIRDGGVASVPEWSDGTGTALVGPDGRKHAVPFVGHFRVDHGLAAREALLAGRGLAPVHRWLVSDLLADSRLEQILPDYALESVPLNLLIVPERAHVRRVRLLVDFLIARIGEIPGLGPS